VELTVNAAGVRVSYDTGEHLVRWKLFSEIIVLDTHVIIAYADHVGGVCIPRGVFVDDQHLQASLATLRAWLVHSGVDDTARIRDLLSKTHVNCKCGQDLFGLTTNTCPECGHTWRYHTLSMHNYVQNPTAFKAD
jgi:ribosomal protein L37E